MDVGGLDPRQLGYLMAGSLGVLTSVLLAITAALVLRAAPRRPANQLFALFLVLIAINGLTDGTWKILNHSDDAAARELGALIKDLGYATQVSDPGVLLYFALIYPRRSPLVDRAWFRPALVGTWVAFVAALALLPGDITTAPHSTPAAIAFLGYLCLCYLASYLVLLHRVRGERSDALLRQETLLVGAFGVALVFRLGLAAASIVQPADPDLNVLLRPLYAALALAIFAGAAAWSLQGAAQRNRAALLEAHRITGAGLGVLTLVWVAPVALVPLSGLNDAMVFAVSTGAIFFLRWLLFCLIAGYALLRYQVLDIDVQVHRARSAAGAAAAVLTIAVLALLAGSALAAAGAALAPEHLLGVVVAVLAAPAAARWGAQVAGGSPRPRDARASEDRRLEVYQATLEAALVGGVLPNEAEADLHDLRRSLGVSEEQHDLLLRAARRASRGQAADEPGLLAGRYELGEVLGRGSTGRCVLARDLLLGRSVVVKQMPRVPGDSREGVHEARAAGRLNHPNIVTVYDVLQRPGITNIVMEHAEGGSLRDLLRRGPPPPERALALVEDILAGLAAAHAADLVHGDLKPENILLAADGRAKLGDFGSASRGTPRGTFASLPSRPGPGTLLYMAPEQVEGQGPTRASDRYAVAAIAWELLHGKHYLGNGHEGDFAFREAILRTTPRPARHLSPLLQAWLMKGLAKDPARRWRHADEMLAGLRLATGNGGGAREPERGPLTLRGRAARSARPR